MLGTGTVVKIHDGIMRAKLKAATPNILAHNVKLVTSMLEVAKPIVADNTPVGPGHFGFHGRDSLRIEIYSSLKSTRGKLLGAAQMGWREFGTRGRSRKLGGAWLTVGQSKQVTASGLFGEGERAFLTAHKAVNSTRRFISFYYGGMATWWHL